jgi:type 1 glutamine amidotransferase
MKAIVAVLLACDATLSASAGEKNIILIAGKQSHGPGDHEFRAGCLLLQQCLEPVAGVRVKVYTNGWPDSDSALDGADAVVIYSDGGPGHPAIQGNRIQVIDALVKKGVGIGCMHYAVEVPKGEAGQAMQRWIGGFYEHQFSVNPMWVPNYRSYPDHAVSRGVGPFALLDEWYFNLRWPEDQKGITHILVDKPSDKVRKGPYVYPPGPYEHIVAASGRQETMMWTFDRPDGGRGFGFTGGHKHVNWSNDHWRKVVLNAILWVAKAEIPANGVSSKVLPEQLTQNLDPKLPALTVPNLTGHWKCQVETDNGSGEPSFTFVHAGQNLLGRYKGLLGEADVFGSVNKSNRVSFGFTGTRNDQELPVAYSGQIEAPDKMKGSVKFGEVGQGTWKAQKE